MIEFFFDFELHVHEEIRRLHESSRCLTDLLDGIAIDCVLARPEDEPVNLHGALDCRCVKVLDFETYIKPELVKSNDVRWPVQAEPDLFGG